MEFALPKIYYSNICIDLNKHLVHIIAPLKIVSNWHSKYIFTLHLQGYTFETLFFRHSATSVQVHRTLNLDCIGEESSREGNRSGFSIKSPRKQ